MPGIPDLTKTYSYADFEAQHPDVKAARLEYEKALTETDVVDFELPSEAAKRFNQESFDKGRLVERFQKASQGLGYDVVASIQIGGIVRFTSRAIRMGWIPGMASAIDMHSATHKELRTLFRAILQNLVRKEWM